MKRRKNGRRIFLVLLAFCIVLGCMLWDSNVRIVTTEYEITSPALPGAFSGYRIMQLSDIHAAKFGGGYAPVVDAVRKADPDIIAVTGDLMDDAAQIPYVRALMAELCDVAPVYYVSGNHEWGAGFAAARDLFAQLEEEGVTVLRNKYTTITLGEDSIVLAGIDDPNGPADMIRPAEFMQRVRQQTAQDAYVVLLAHRNDRIEEYAALGADLVLCGHGHGGLIRLPFTDGLISTTREWFPSYTSGLYVEGNTTFLVSRGIGNHTGVPRFLNNPHVAVAVLKNAG